MHHRLLAFPWRCEDLRVARHAASGTFTQRGQKRNAGNESEADDKTQTRQKLRALSTSLLAILVRPAQAEVMTTDVIDECCVV